MTRYNSFEKFTISSKPVTADYIHAGVFVPDLNPTNDTEQFTFSPLGNTGIRLAYWDQDAWASELVVSTGSPRLCGLTAEAQSRSAADQAAAAAEKEGLLEPGKEAEIKSKKRKAEASGSSKQKKVFLPLSSLVINFNLPRPHPPIFNFGAIDMQSCAARSPLRPSIRQTSLEKLSRKTSNLKKKSLQLCLTSIHQRSVAICVSVNSSPRLR